MDYPSLRGTRTILVSPYIPRSHVSNLESNIILTLCPFYSYVGAQESVSTSFNNYVHQAFHSSTINTSTWAAIGHSCFAGGRFLAAALNTFIKSRYLLLFFFLGSIALSVVAMHYKGTAPQTAVMLLYFFEGPIFSLIFANSLRGLGKYTKDGSALLTAAISGGAAWPPVMYGAAKGGHKRYQYAYCVVAAALAIGILLPLWQNLVPAARKLSDPVKSSNDDGDESSGSGRSNGSGRGFGAFKRKRNDTEHVERAGSNTDTAHVEKATSKT
jgi:fucose permease